MLFNATHIRESESSVSSDGSLLLIRNNANFGVGANFFQRGLNHLHRKRAIGNLSVMPEVYGKGALQLRKKQLIAFFSSQRYIGAHRGSIGVTAVGPSRYFSQLENEPLGSSYLPQEDDEQPKP